MIKKIGNFIWSWFIRGLIFFIVTFSIYNSFRTKKFYMVNIVDTIQRIRGLKDLLTIIFTGFLFSTLVELLKHSLITTFNWFVESSWKMRIYIIISSCLIIYGVLRKIL
ncbi:MAG: hypothetical protein ACRCZO_13085 [Cetobacterium sp.]